MSRPVRTHRARASIGSSSLAALSIAAACSSASPSSASQTPAQGQIPGVDEARELAYRWTTGTQAQRTMTYVSTRTRRVDGMLESREMKTQITTGTATVVASDDGFTVEYRVDETDLADDPLVADETVEMLMNATFTQILSPRGIPSSGAVEATDSLPAVFASMIGVPILPESPVAVGSTWDGCRALRDMAVSSNVRSSCAVRELDGDIVVVDMTIAVAPGADEPMGLDGECTYYVALDQPLPMEMTCETRVLESQQIDGHRVTQEVTQRQQLDAPVVPVVRREVAPRAPDVHESAPRVSEHPEGGPLLDTGVAACDTPFNEYITCIRDKAPEVGRQQLFDGMRMSAEAWVEAVRVGVDEDELVKACTMVANAWEQSAEALGCSW